MRGKDRGFSSFLSAILRLGICTAAMLLLAVPAYAHGEVGPAELGPPLAISCALAVISYWIVMLWPRRPEGGRDDGPDDEDGGPGGGRYPGPLSDLGKKAGKVRLLVKVSTRDGVPVVAGSDESEGVDHGEERFATHSGGSDLSGGRGTRGVWAR